MTKKQVIAPVELSRGQKAARTRAANKAARMVATVPAPEAPALKGWIATTFGPAFMNAKARAEHKRTVEKIKRVDARDKVKAAKAAQRETAKAQREAATAQRIADTKARDEAAKAAHAASLTPTTVKLTLLTARTEYVAADRANRNACKNYSDYLTGVYGANWFTVVETPKDKVTENMADAWRELKAEGKALQLAVISANGHKKGCDMPWMRARDHARDAWEFSHGGKPQPEKKPRLRRMVLALASAQKMAMVDSKTTPVTEREARFGEEVKALALKYGARASDFAA